MKALVPGFFKMSSKDFPWLDRAVPLLAASCPFFPPLFLLPFPLLAFVPVKLLFPCGPCSPNAAVPCSWFTLGERDRTHCLKRSTSWRSCATSALWTAVDAEGVWARSELKFAMVNSCIQCSRASSPACSVPTWLRSSVCRQCLRSGESFAPSAARPRSSAMLSR